MMGHKNYYSMSEHSGLANINQNPTIAKFMNKIEDYYLI